MGVLLQGADHVYTVEELETRVATGKPLRVKLGLDPTAPDLTLGHTVVLRKMRQFQDAGHKAVLIIGDYTAKIGDPTGRSKTRPMLNNEQIKRNAATYIAQAGKVLDLSEEKLEIRYNSEWLSSMTYADVIGLLGQMTVARMLERDTFAKRQAEGKEIYLHELLYPVMQAKDSVEIRADVELGGTDQTFNNLCGRDYQRHAGQPPQIVLVMPLLVGTDGKEKMSKSQGNSIGVTDPPSEMFGKIMRVPDPLMGDYFKLLTDVPEAEITTLVDITQSSPRETKEKLAKLIISQYHSREAADAAASEFQRVHGGTGGGLPDVIPELSIPTDKLDGGRIAIVDLVRLCGFADSKSDARRLIKERGFRINQQVVEDMTATIDVKHGDVLQRGKRRFVRLSIS
ncbi:MAG: tyrosine--tRNA ligase [Planctomycetes bacterium]|nr:tyrosine--tRNA ligase [Planctomycetota bacterium]